MHDCTLHVYATKGTEPLMTGIQGTDPCGDSCKGKIRKNTSKQHKNSRW